MKKLTRKTLITILSLALIIVILGTTTFAWITISNRAAVSGMEFEVDTPNGLQIERGDVIIEKNFTNRIIESNYNTIKYLQPVSTVNGENFFFTPNLLTGVSGNGQLNANAKIYEYDPESFAQLYNGIYDVKVEGYAEYTYILKATASSEDLNIYLNELNFNYTGNEDASNSYNAFRVAVLIKQYNNGEFDANYTSLGIIDSTGSRNNTNGAAVGNTTNASIITVNNKDYNVLLSNYGYTLYENGGQYFKDLDADAYELLSGDKALADTANKYNLGKAEFVLGVSFTQHANGLYEFTTNLGNKVYGANQESVENDTFYEADGATPVVLDPEAETVTGTSSVMRKDINGAEYYEFTTSRGATVYGKNADSAANNAYYTLHFVDEEVVASNTYLQEVQKFDATEPILEVAQGQIDYVMVTFRIYVEGEDQNCVAQSFIALNSNYQMDVAFGFEKPESNLKLK